MANKTYLQMVNDVLIRLREAEVASVSTNDYSKLIGKFVNDAKKYVEDAWDWAALEDTVTITTSNNTSAYALTGAGVRCRVKRVYNQDSEWFLDEEARSKMEENTRGANVQKGSPDRYCFKGVDASNDAKVLLFPVPDAAYDIDFDLIIPQDDLSSDSTVILVPDQPVILFAVSMAIRERGEDGGLGTAEAFQLAQSSLGDYIAIEQGRSGEQTYWEAV